MALSSDKGRVRVGHGLWSGGWRASSKRTMFIHLAGGVLAGGLLGGAMLAAVTLSFQAAALLAVAIVGMAGLLIIGHVRRVLLAILLLDLPLQVDVNLAYMDAPAALGALGGLNISLTTACLVGLYLLWLAQGLARVDSPGRPRWALVFPLVFYVASALLSLSVAQDAQLARFEVALLVQTFLVYVYIIATVRTRSDVVFVVVMLLIGLALESLIIFYVYLSGRNIDLPGLSTRVDVGIGLGSRVAGTLGSPNSAAIYLSMLLAPALSVTLTPLGARYRTLASLSAALGSIALLVTFTRGGWFAAGLSLAIVGFFAWRRGWLSPVVPALAVVVLMALVVVFREPILARIFEDDQGSAESRIPLMRLALEMIRDRPLLGVSPNNFAVMIEQYATPEYGRTWLFVVHNKYLLVWAETGLVGLIAFVAFLLVTLRRGWRGWQLNDRTLSPLALGLTAGVVGNMVYMLVDLFSGRGQVQLLWLIAGLIAAIPQIEDDRTWS